MHENSRKDFNIPTLAIHFGESPDLDHPSSVPDITMSNTFLADPNVSFSAENLEDDSPFTYSRWSNPTVEILEKKVAAMENGEAALAFSSGMAAVTSLMIQKLKAGDVAVVSDISYAGVREFGNDILSEQGVKVIPVNMSDLQEVKQALNEKVKLVFIETPCNPILRLSNIREIALLTHEAGAELAVDSTFATPMATRPLDHGADYVIHSMTKYLGGHGDAMGGIIAGRNEEIRNLKHRVRVHMGAVISPFNAWLINRGLATLPLRMKAHSENARKIAGFLENHSKVKRVIYPGLESHPQHNLAKKQMDLFSGMLTFCVNNPQELIAGMNEKFRVFHYAVSLGHHKSLLFYLPTDEMNESTFKLSEKGLEAYKQFAGEGIFRVSIGLEDPDDLIDDLNNFL